MFIIIICIVNTVLREYEKLTKLSKIILLQDCWTVGGSKLKL